MALQRRVSVGCEDGLHARPAMQFAEIARKFKSAVTVTKDGRLVDAKSILDLLTLAADRGSELIVDVDGEDEEEAMNMVVSFLEGTCSQ